MGHKNYALIELYDAYSGKLCREKVPSLAEILEKNQNTNFTNKPFGAQPRLSDTLYIFMFDICLSLPTTIIFTLYHFILSNTYTEVARPLLHNTKIGDF